MDAGAELRTLFDTRRVVVERLEPLPSSWHALVEEVVVRLLASGWRRRRRRLL